MTSSNAANYQALMATYCQQYGLDKGIIFAQVNQESGWRADAVSSAGALGIAQMMPGTAASLGVDPMDPASALHGMAKYMAYLVGKYGGDYSRALAAYNAGEGAVDKYGGVPPYAETESYVSTILGNAGHATGPSVSPNTPYAGENASGNPANAALPNSGMASPTAPSVPSAAPPALVSPWSTTVYPGTNYAVVPGSAAYGDVLYGRRYRVLVLEGGAGTAPTILPDTAAGQANAATEYTALDVSNLHCTFSCVKTFLPQPVWSTLTIYNLSPETENAIINEGFRVIIEAGYYGSQYGVIFDGNALQVIRDKPDATTYTLTLVSMDGDAFLAYGTSIFTVLRGQNSRAIMGQVASTASVPTELGRISPNLSTTTLPRGKAVFGKSADILRQIARSENATFHFEDGKVHVTKAEDFPLGDIIDLTPANGLIGVPQQQDYGIVVKMLLNPRVKVGGLLHVDNSLVRNQQYGSTGSPLYTLDKDGIYRVIRAEHSGDSRGDDWTTTATAVTQSGVLPNLISQGGQALW